MMAKITIPANTKVADIAGDLKEPIDYIGGMLKVLIECGSRRGRDDFLVFLSLQSDPSAPDYSIYEVMDIETGQGEIISVRSGRTHKELPYNRASSFLWTHQGSIFSELQEVMGRVRAEQKAALG